MSENAPDFFNGPNGRLAYRLRHAASDGPMIVWLGGFRSDMLGSKAERLDAWARATGRGYLRFDYSGHGESDGVFEDGCISDWRNDASAILDALAPGPVILVGSSMGGWIATLLGPQLGARLKGVLYIAPAPDFTEQLMWPALSEKDRETLARDGRLEQHSAYSDAPTVLTQRLFEDGRAQQTLGAPIAISAKVRILQGMDDPDVPWRHAMRLVEALDSTDVAITLIKGGDHRLSDEQNLERLTRTLDDMLAG